MAEGPGDASGTEVEEKPPPDTTDRFLVEEKSPKLPDFLAAVGFEPVIPGCSHAAGCSEIAACPETSGLPK